MASADILRAAHSPLPFEAAGEAVFSDTACIAVCDAWDLSDEGDAANAAFIVRACNAHYQMLEALKVAQASLAMLTEPAHVRTSTVHQAWGQAVEAELKVRLAIAAAEAEAGR